MAAGPADARCCPGISHLRPRPQEKRFRGQSQGPVHLHIHTHTHTHSHTYTLTHTHTASPSRHPMSGQGECFKREPMKNKRKNYKKKKKSQ